MGCWKRVGGGRGHGYDKIGSHTHTLLPEIFFVNVGGREENLCGPGNDFGWDGVERGECVWVE